MSNKRQKRNNNNNNNNNSNRISSPPLTTPTPNQLEDFYVEAFESSLIYNNSNLALQVESKVGEVEGGRMQKWNGVNEDDQEIWIDRYDILNLLDVLPLIPPSSPTHEAGFEDLPEEELFYFDVSEREEVSRKRKKRMMEFGREERIRVMQESDRLEEEAKRLENEPSEEQLALMHKLNTTLASSPDPAILIIRILANHGVEAKFSFLRKGGKFREHWEKIQKDSVDAIAATKLEQEKEEVEAGAKGNNLVTYASDSDEEEVEKEEVGEEKKDKDREELEVAAGEAVVVEVEETEEERLKKEVKAEKLKEWVRKRKEAREKALV